VRLAQPAFLLVVLARCAAPPPHTATLSGLDVLQALADSGKELPRPRLAAGADTNDASLYYKLGESLLFTREKLDTAEMALYWASRLDPSSAAAPFARSLIPLSALRSDAFETWLRTHSFRSVKKLTLPTRQIRVVDSLQRIAWQRNPFLFSSLEFHDAPPLVNIQGRQRDPIREGWWAFSERRFVVAESLFAVGLKKHPEDVGIRVYRARALFYLGRYDAAVAELEAARDTVVRAVEARMSPVLPSVEMFDFAIGIARVQQDDFPAARAAFERALTANLGFYWAHTRLAGSALALHDTAAALAELETAVQLDNSDPVLLLYQGVVLQTAGHLTESKEPLQRAIEVDPFFAAPYYWLAVAHRKSGDSAAAMGRYRQFLELRQDPYRVLALRDLAALGAAVPDSR
jgi:tetratricopeptide (TPR) repeat protein